MEFEKNDQILEIGFGTGKFFDKLFDGNDTIQVNGIDYSEDMVEMARETNQENISKGNLKIIQGNRDAIPFPDHSFDKVFCNMVIYFWDQPEKHLKEIKRVLKPGGMFYTGLRTRVSMLVFPFVEYGFNLYSIKEWKENLNKNGFKSQQIHKRFDPQMEIDGNNLQLESCCIVAQN
jgi:ubiquinone/menaquinone biosynthesis C-methylase UbiE